MSDRDFLDLRPPAATMTSVAPVPCPECRAPFPPDDLGPHLHQAHKYQFFHGLWRSPVAAIDDAIPALVSPNPDPNAWRILAAAAHALHGPRTIYVLAAKLGAALERLADADRAAAVEGIAGILADAGAGAAFAAALASDDATAAHHLALALLGWLPPPLEPMLFQPAQLLLLDRRLPAAGQLTLAALLLRSVPPDDPRAGDFLQTLVGGLGRSRSIARLRDLEKRAGRHPAIAAAVARLEERLRMACPRCGAEMRRPDMIRHLWEEHRLVLAGRRVREPRSVIEEWIEAYQARPDPELLDRCRVLAERLDPDRGRLQINRLFLRHGIADPDARAALLQAAEDNHASLCGACYAEVPVPREVPPFEIYQRSGRLAARGYSVEVSERGLRSRVEVRTPAKLVYRGPEPLRGLTSNGTLLAVVGPLVAVAVVLAIVVPRSVAVTAVIWASVLAAFVYGVTRLAVRGGASATERARTYAWLVLAPRLHAHGLAPDDAAFLAGLADASAGDGYAAVRAKLVPGLLKQTEEAVVAGKAPPSLLAPLMRLAVEDITAGGDPIPAVAGQLARCFEGQLPLAVAEHLLAGWSADWWTDGNLARLRVLLCDYAFGAGFEVHDLLEAGESAPALAEVLDTANPHGLAALRLLWSLRSSRPWDRCGEAHTVFELAEDVTNAGLLEQYPNLLLHQEEPRWIVAAEKSAHPMGPAQILVETSGVRLQGVEFVSTPLMVEVTTKSFGDLMLLGPHQFRGPQPLDDLAARMERWFHFAFREFLPMTRAAAHWHTPDGTTVLRSRGTVACPECGKSLLPRVGEVATLLKHKSNR